MHNPKSFNSTASIVSNNNRIGESPGVINIYSDSPNALEVIAVGSYFVANNQLLTTFEFIGSVEGLDKALSDIMTLDCEFISRWYTGNAFDNSINVRSKGNNPIFNLSTPVNPLFALATLWSV